MAVKDFSCNIRASSSASMNRTFSDALTAARQRSLIVSYIVDEEEEEGEEEEEDTLDNMGRSNEES